MSCMIGGGGSKPQVLWNLKQNDFDPVIVPSEINPMKTLGHDVHKRQMECSFQHHYISKKNPHLHEGTPKRTHSGKVK